MVRTLLLIGVLYSLTARAELNVETADVAPDAGVVLSCPAAGTSDLRWYFQTSSPLARRDVGQVIEPTESVSVTKLSVQLADHEKAIGRLAGGAPVRLRWYEFEDVAGLFQQKPLAEQEGHLPAEIAPGQQLIFGFPPVALEAGKRYAAILNFEAANAEYYVNFAVAPRRNYPEGQILFFTTTADQPELHFTEFSANLVFGLMEK